MQAGITFHSHRTPPFKTVIIEKKDSPSLIDQQKNFNIIQDMYDMGVVTLPLIRSILTS